MSRRQILGLVLIVMVVTASASTATWTWRRGRWHDAHAAAQAASAHGFTGADVLDIHELVLRDLLADAQPGEICFIAFVGDVYQHINPPAGFLQRFSDLGLEMKPASEALPPPRRGGPIRDQATGRPGRLYYATVTKLGASQVEVAGVRYSGPLAAGGYHAVVRKQGGRWVLDAKSKSGWVS
jgi:hypothetical protein